MKMPEYAQIYRHQLQIKMAHTNIKGAFEVKQGFFSGSLPTDIYGNISSLTGQLLGSGAQHQQAQSQEGGRGAQD